MVMLELLPLTMYSLTIHALFLTIIQPYHFIVKLLEDGLKRRTFGSFVSFTTTLHEL